VAATAPGGRIALAKIGDARPDVVTLDVQMPNWDGLKALAEIRLIYPQLPVIMCSTLTTRGATTALDALALGATDYIAKPTNLSGAPAPMSPAPAVPAWRCRGPPSAASGSRLSRSARRPAGRRR
jgi:two-component system chemotaxis response regulator CheB